MMNNLIVKTRSNAAKKKTERTKIGFLFSMLTIPMLNFLIFWVYVNYKSISLAFELPNGAFTLMNFKWVFENFVSADKIMFEALKNTLIFFIAGIGIGTPLSLVMSYFLYKRISGFKLFRVVFFLPSIISTVVLTTVYKAVIGPTGPISEIIKFFGGVTPEFLADSRYALGSVVLYNILMGFGTNVILMSGAMARIPIEIMESASLDGIGLWRELVSIVLPLMWSTISTLLVFSIAGLFSASGPLLLLTKGYYGTMTISYWIFDQVNTYQSYWNASAAGLFYTVVGVPIALGGKYLLERVCENVEY